MVNPMMLYPPGGHVAILRGGPVAKRGGSTPFLTMVFLPVVLEDGWDVSSEESGVYWLGCGVLRTCNRHFGQLRYRSTSYATNRRGAQEGEGSDREAGAPLGLIKRERLDVDFQVCGKYLSIFADCYENDQSTRLRQSQD